MDFCKFWIGQCEADRPMRRCCVFLLAAIFVAGGQTTAMIAQTTHPSSHFRPRGDLKPLIDPVLKKHGLPGMAAALIQGKDVVAIGVGGVRRLGNTDPITLDDCFHMGSCTKSMTATLCASLVEKHELTWDITLAQAFPKLAPSMHQSYRGVTLEQLLTNRGGFPKDIARPLWDQLWAFRGMPSDARGLLLTDLSAQPPAGKPGVDYLYSNAGFSVAGHIAETVAGRAWEDLMFRNLFIPLGMKEVGFGAPGTPGRLDQPRGHTKDGKPVEPGPFGKGDNPIAIGPANSVHCTIEEWGKYVAMHLAGERGQSRFLKRDTFKKLHSPASGFGDKYAMGWIVTERDWGGGTVLNHFGSNTLWSANVWIAPRRNFAVIVTCNQGGDEAFKATDEVVSAIIQYQQSRH